MFKLVGSAFSFFFELHELDEKDEIEGAQRL